LGRGIEPELRLGETNGWRPTGTPVNAVPIVHVRADDEQTSGAPVAGSERIPAGEYEEEPTTPVAE
jgi:hypothetical protein